VLNYVGIFSDITEIKQHQENLERIAHYDALTSLPNRLLLADRLGLAMSQVKRRGKQLAVVYLDLDGFKEINDEHGHDVGDHLLQALANRMKEVLREGDTIARLGGDEFVAVMIDLEDAQSSVPLLNRLLDAASRPVSLRDLILRVSASIGVTFYPQQEEVEADQLLRQADQAMYQAKMAGKNRYYMFDVDVDRDVRGRHETLERIRQGLVDKEFVLYYQPKVNMRSGEVVGAEALIRWQHPDQGVLTPYYFLPVIEDHQLSIVLGDWVIDTAIAQLAQWHAAGIELPVSVNVSAHQIQQKDFIERLQAKIQGHEEIVVGSLVFEILETSALEDMEHVSSVMQKCQDMGIDFALDDFGTGYSSLTYLKRLPAAELKIDQSFVQGVLDDPEDMAILEGIMGLSRAFRRKLVAEGVETIEHGEILLYLGCEQAQGYAIAHPMPADKFPAWQASWQPDETWRETRELSTETLPWLFALTEHRAWVLAVTQYIRGDRKVFVEVNPHECRFGQWLYSKAVERCVPREQFESIERRHRDIHKLVGELFELDAAGEREQAERDLDRLQAMSEMLVRSLKSILAQGNC
jgi:diguanylate cyclase (GGDEF)-like protein